jgi:methionyl-tRNA synthetase
MAPWALKKTDPPRMQEVLAVLAEVIRQVAILVQPIMPEATSRMLDQLGVDDDARGFDRIGGATRLPSGHVIEKPEPVFPRYIVDEV